MISEEAKSVIARAKEIYARQLKQELEKVHHDQFVAIEPQSEEYFIADSFDEAVRQARAKHPTKLSHTIHIGHAAAFQIGLMTK
ncbi:hypothetical protein [Calycomorphotria hydatis]|uniref:DUF5678 domain-containing protein n=1 Tax=Calycomorphotria hydatis TaxID=2528027 RepID=A0A517TCI8_9PLAN|nr:hypothetical protein [Calycomorphotria hydatis]QDT66080.1 hypothetical protein V22_33440 [Calycomorphotria hydatis]